MFSLPFWIPACFAAPFVAYYGVAAILAIKDPQALRSLEGLHPLRWWRRKD